MLPTLKQTLETNQHEYELIIIFFNNSLRHLTSHLKNNLGTQTKNGYIISRCFSPL